MDSTKVCLKLEKNFGIFLNILYQVWTLDLPYSDDKYRACRACLLAIFVPILYTFYTQTRQECIELFDFSWDVILW